MNSKSMIRTFAFAGAAILFTLLAVAANRFSKPVKLEGEGDYGKDFNPDFTDAGKATSIQVVAWDEATATAKPFGVEYKDGWKIPTYHDYPADGKDQLAKAAASVIGLKRGSLASRYKTDHERFGVIDPLDEDNQATKGRGTRITLRQKEVALADFIVGHKVEGLGEDKRYLRKFGEDKVYVVAAKFEVSTKFADWAETDLLKATGWDFTRLRAVRPKINADDENEGEEIVELTREKSDGPWKLADLDEAAEELKADEITTMVSTLDDLRLVGVRQRPSFQGKPILNADLKVELPKELLADPRIRSEIVKVLRTDLGEKGFKVGQDEEGRSQIVSPEGELSAGTKDGVLYRLTFGSVFSGNEQEIETGNKEDPKADGKGKKKTSKDRPEDQKKSRYLIVRVSFDEKLLGPPPVEPTKPTPPPGLEPTADDKKEDAPKDEAKKKDPASETDKPADSKKKSDDADDGKCDDDKETKPPNAAKDEEKKPAAEDKKDEKKTDAAADKPKTDAADAKKEDAKPEEPKRDLKAEYFEALKRYDGEKGRFVSETKVFEAKIEMGKHKVKELNDRFADWYYVISNDSFDKLRLSRAVLIKPKEKPADKTDAAKDADGDPVKPATNDDKPAAEKKEPEKKEPEKKEPEKKEPEKKEPEKKETEKKETEKKETEKKADDK